MIIAVSCKLSGRFANPSRILQDLPIVRIVIEAYSEAYSAVRFCKGCLLRASLHATAYAVYPYVLTNWVRNPKVQNLAVIGRAGFHNHPNKLSVRDICSPGSFH